MQIPLVTRKVEPRSFFDFESRLRDLPSDAKRGSAFSSLITEMSHDDFAHDIAAGILHILRSGDSALIVAVEELMTLLGDYANFSDELVEVDFSVAVIKYLEVNLG